MKILFRLAVVFLIIFLAMMIFGAINSGEREDEKKEISIRHCELDWAVATDSIKEVVLNEFIDNNGIDPVDGSFRYPGMVAAELLPKYVKYPNTIIIDDKPLNGFIYFNYGTIENIEHGLFSLSKAFTAENKLGMKVKGSFVMNLKYQAGCENFKLMTFIVE